jgi:methionyl aminopeptidase
MKYSNWAKLMGESTTELKAAPHTQMVLVSGPRESHGGAMGVEIYSGAEVDGLRRVGSVAAATLERVVSQVRAGISTADIDAWVRQDTQGRGAVPSQLGYQGFPAAVCVSRNNVVCHGIPSPAEILETGDIVNVDVTSEIGGFHGDTSTMILIGEVSPEAAHLVSIARRCRDAGIAVVRPGARLGDIAQAIMEVAKAGGCSVVRELGGHGIGRRMHQEPHVSYVGRAGRGLRLQAGMAITIEPMINLGGAGVVFLDDGWTVKTADGSLSAQFEHTVLVTAEGAEILTLPPIARAPASD